MRIEDVTIEKCWTCSDKELWNLRFRFTQLFEKYFESNDKAVVGVLCRDAFLEKYDILTKVIKERGRKIPTRAIDKALFKAFCQKKDEVAKSLILLVKDEDEEEHIVMGIVYEPEEVDSQGDTATAVAIRKACHYFSENSQVMNVNHRGGRISASMLENYIAPQELTIAGRVVKEGTWLMSVRINDPEVWKKIKEGDLTGFSMEGIGRRIALDSHGNRINKE